MNELELKKALDKTKINLIMRKDSVFITTICFGLIHEFDDTIPTAATNGKFVKYNRSFFSELSEQERVGLMLHETWHVVFDHVGALSRIQNRDPVKWNSAGDYVINNMLVNTGVTIPAGGLVDPQYNDMSTEQIYDLLPDETPPPHMQDLLPGEGDPEEAKAALDDLIIQASLKAEAAGNFIGNLPDDIQVRLKELTNPKLPWNKILSKFFNSFAKNEYSFRKPNRRFLPDYIIPSAHSEVLGCVAMAIDMSGSVSDDETSQFISDVYAVLKTIKLKELNLVQFDTRVFSVDTIKTTNELMKISFKGRGGTNVTPVMEWAIENKPDVLVIFTDGYFRAPRVDPKVPVIWIIYNNPSFTADFGTVIHYEQ